MVQDTCTIKHRKYDAKALSILQSKYFKPMQKWRQKLVLSHKCNCEGCIPSIILQDMDIYDQCNGDGICHLTTYVLSTNLI